MDNVFLCGYMGSGKSTIGVLLAKKLGKRFLDLDAFIEKRAGKKISEIFELYGEDTFRRLETAVLKEVCSMNGVVVAVGGGTLSYEHNIVATKESGLVIYLQVPFEKCYNRIKKSRTRPLVKTNSKDELEALYHKRHTIYKICANYIYEPNFAPQLCAKQLCEYYISKKGNLTNSHKNKVVF